MLNALHANGFLIAVDDFNKVNISAYEIIRHFDFIKVEDMDLFQTMSIIKTVKSIYESKDIRFVIKSNVYYYDVEKLLKLNVSFLQGFIHHKFQLLE
ncbi:TPA: hypothetical protein ACX3FR_004182 [Vibrio parahaemolyticus]